MQINTERNYTIFGFKKNQDKIKKHKLCYIVFLFIFYNTAYGIEYKENTPSIKCYRDVDDNNWIKYSMPSKEIKTGKGGKYFISLVNNAIENRNSFPDFYIFIYEKAYPNKFIDAAEYNANTSTFDNNSKERIFGNSEKIDGKLSESRVFSTTLKRNTNYIIETTFYFKNEICPDVNNFFIDVEKSHFVW